MLNEANSEIVQFYEKAWHGFFAAWQESQTSQSVWLTVGGSVLQLLFANDAIVPLFLPALSHLVIPAHAARAADLEIALWDSASTGVPMQPPPWAEDDYLARGEIRGVDADPIVQVAYHLGSGVLSLFHQVEKKALLWMANAERCPYYEQAAPLRTIFHWWCTVQGQQFVHGAAIGVEEGAVLITGKGGSGKSTTALSAALMGEMLYLGDDYVLCELSEGTARVFSVYNSAKVDSNTLRLLSLSAEQLINRDRFSHSFNSLSHYWDATAAGVRANSEKGVLLLQRNRPDLVRASLPLRAVIVPKITNETKTRLLPLKPAQAFIALTPTTVFQLPGAERGALAFLRRLVMQLPCYQLQLGGELSQSHAVIRSLIQGSEGKDAP